MVFSHRRLPLIGSVPTRLSLPSATASTGEPNGAKHVVALVRADLARAAEVVGHAGVAVDGEDDPAAAQAALHRVGLALGLRGRLGGLLLRRIGRRGGGGRRRGGGGRIGPVGRIGVDVGDHDRRAGRPAAARAGQRGLQASALAVDRHVHAVAVVVALALAVADQAAGDLQALDLAVVADVVVLGGRRAAHPVGRDQAAEEADGARDRAGLRLALPAGRRRGRGGLAAVDGQVRAGARGLPRAVLGAVRHHVPDPAERAVGDRRLRAGARRRLRLGRAGHRAATAASMSTATSGMRRRAFTTAKQSDTGPRR